MVDRKTQFLTTADGRTLCFAEWARADGVSVFALHVSPGSRLDVAAETEAVVTELGGRLITYDRPGYGRSDPRDPATRVVDHVEDVREIADRLGIDGFSITGSSGGAPHALAVAARLPDRVPISGRPSSSRRRMRPATPISTTGRELGGPSTPG
jgi:pimeloyl-ACP methyl ester carboxylesterase